MAATDQTYRNQKTLHIVFGASCVLMLAGTFWMIYQDYMREFKPIQRTFYDVEDQRNLRVMLEQLPSGDVLEEKITAAAEARKEYDKEAAKYRETERNL